MGAPKEATGKSFTESVSNVSRQGACTRNKKARQPVFNQHLGNTKMCAYYIKGACTYGDACTFAHSFSSLRASPDLQKTRLCEAFTEGSCNDTECRFAHSEEELRSMGNFYKKTLCIWFEKGKCRNGQQCRFAHGLSELQKHVSETQAAATQFCTPTTTKAKTSLADGGSASVGEKRFAAKEVANVVPALRLHDRLHNFQPVKVIPPSLNSWPSIPTAEYSKPFYTDYMLKNMMRHYRSCAPGAKTVENSRALTKELSMLHEHVRALSEQCKVLEQEMQKMQDGFSPSTGSTVAPDFGRGTSEGSLDSDLSCSLSQDLEPLSPPFGLHLH